jgi:hypothetical protein
MPPPCQAEEADLHSIKHISGLKTVRIIRPLDPDQSAIGSRPVGSPGITSDEMS